MAKLEPYRGDYYLWNYIPSMAAAVIFIVLFLITTGLHTWRIYKTKSWFCIAFTIGCLCKYPSISLEIWACSNLYSRGHRLHRTSEGGQQYRQAPSICHPKLLHPRCSSLFGRIDLHDTRPNYTICPRRTSFYHSDQLAHKNFRHRGSFVIFRTSRILRVDVQWQHCQSWWKGRVGRSIHPDHSFWVFLP